MDRFNTVKPRFGELADEHELGENWLSGVRIGSSGSTSTGCVPKPRLETIKILLWRPDMLADSVPRDARGRDGRPTPRPELAPIIFLGAAEP